MMNLEFRSDDYREGEHAKYDLFLEISYYAGYVGLFDRERDTFVRIAEFKIGGEKKDFIREAEKVLKALPEMKGPFRSQSVSFITQRFTLVPGKLFDKTKVNEIFSFNFSKVKTEEVSFDTAPDLDVAIVYSVPFMFRSMITRLFDFKPVTVTSHILHFLEGIWKKHDSEKNEVFSFIREDMFDIFALGGGKLKFANAFPYKAPQDIAYYTVNLFEQLRLPREADVHLYGRVTTEDEVYTLLKKYLSGVQVVSDPAFGLTSHKFLLKKA